MSKFCSGWSSVIGLGTSSTSLERGDRIGAASGCEEVEVEFITGVGGVIGWKKC